MHSLRNNGVSGTIETKAMFDWSLDPRAQLAVLCFVTALYYWNNDPLFFLFASLAIFSRFFGQEL